MTPPQQTLRLFVAFDAPAEVRGALETLSERLRGVTWTPPSQYHVTLRFIGETPADRLERISQSLARIAVESFIVPVRGVGAFPPERPPRVLWAGLGEAHPRLFQLRQQVDDALLAAGLAGLDVRTFQPHFTLARCGRECAPGAVAGFLKKHRDFEGPAFRVNAFRLYESILGTGGAVHRALLEVPLTDRDRSGAPRGAVPPH